MALARKALADIITFTRASTAAYHGTAAALAEQNLLTYSEQFGNSAWAATNMTVAGNATTAPNATETSDSLTPSTDNAEHYLRQTVACTAPTASVFAADNGYNFIWLRLNGISNSTVWFNVATGSVGTTGAGVTAAIVAMPNGHYRCEVRAASGSMTSLDIGVANADNVTSFAGDGSAGAYAWGAQVEARSSASEYTKTTDAPLTRYQPAALATAGTDEPRIEYGADGVCKGLLVEEARTNLLLHSNDLSQAAWSVSGGSARSVVPGPAGGVDAWKVIGNDGGSGANLRHNVAVVAGTAYTFSGYVKAGEFGEVLISFGSAAGTFNAEAARFSMLEGQLLNNPTTDSAEIIAVGNGWYRFECSATAAATDTALLRVTLSDGGAAANGDGFSGVFVSRLQFEAGTFASSYIATGGSTATRAADTADITAAAALIPDPSGYTVAVEAQRASTPGATGNRILQLDNGDDDERLALALSPAGGISVAQFAGGDSLVGEEVFVAAEDFIGQGAVRVAVAVDGATVRRAAQGQSASALALAQLPQPPTALRLGREVGAGSYFNGHIADVQLYPVALQDAALRALTA